MTVQKDPEGNEARRLHKYAQFAGKRVLEIGSGDGRLTSRYADAARHVTGIDLDRDELRIASIEQAARRDRPTHLAQADATRLPFRGDAFDLVLLAWTF